MRALVIQGGTASWVPLPPLATHLQELPRAGVVAGDRGLLVGTDMNRAPEVGLSGPSWRLLRRCSVPCARCPRLCSCIGALAEPTRLTVTRYIAGVTAPGQP